MERCEPKQRALSFQPSKTCGTLRAKFARDTTQDTENRGVLVELLDGWAVRPPLGLAGPSLLQVMPDISLGGWSQRAHESETQRERSAVNALRATKTL